MTTTKMNLNLPWLNAGDTHEVKCFFCDGQNPTEERLTFNVNGKELKIIRCATDDIMFLSPQPGQKYAESLYNHPSYYEGVNDMYGLAVNDEKSQEIAKIRINEILKYKPDAKSILEIGCGFGHTLDEALKNNFEIAEGVEFSQEAIKICKGKKLEVRQGSIQNPFSNFPKTKYDVIAMFSVLEHVENPEAFLKGVEKNMNPHGIFVIRVPEMSPEGPWLSLLDHNWHFTKKSLENLLLKINFKVVDVFPSGIFHGIQHPGSLQSITVIAKLNE